MPTTATHEHAFGYVLEYKYVMYHACPRTPSPNNVRTFGATVGGTNRRAMYDHSGRVR
jgi:hypothetical protein